MQTSQVSAFSAVPFLTRCQTRGRGPLEVLSGIFAGSQTFHLLEARGLVSPPGRVDRSCRSFWVLQLSPAPAPSQSVRRPENREGIRGSNVIRFLLSPTSPGRS